MRVCEGGGGGGKEGFARGCEGVEGRGWRKGDGWRRLEGREDGLEGKEG